MPTAKVNAVTNLAAGGVSQLFQTSSVFYVSVNAPSTTALNDALGNSYFQKGNASTPNALLYFETGISSSTENPPRTINPTEGNRNLYLVSNDLIDSNFDVSVDSRFIRAIRGLHGPGSKWVGDHTTSVTTAVSPGPWTPLAGNRIGLDNYKTGIIASIPNLVAGDTDGTWKKLSDINGPAGVIAVLGVRPSADLQSSSAKFSLFGKVAVNLFGDGNTYDYIDTIVYVVGKTSGITLQIPFRIVRKR